MVGISLPHLAAPTSHRSQYCEGRTYLAADEEPITLPELVVSVGAAVGATVRIVRFPWYGAAWFGAAGVEMLWRTLGRTPPVFRRRLSWFATNRAFRIDRARRELGYSRRVSLQEGLRRTADWYRQQGYLTSVAAAPGDCGVAAGAP